MKYLDLAGVLIATVITNVCTNFWFYPVYTYKNLFSKGPWAYYIKFFVNFVLSIATIYITKLLTKSILMNNYFTLAYKGLIYMVIVAIVLFIFNYAIFKDFRNFVKNMKNLIIDVKNKKKEERFRKNNI